MDPAEATGAVVARKAPPRDLLIAVLVATCASGAAALIYEVAWTRELSLVFGSTVYAVSAMLAAFMSGLALGGWLGGVRADKPGTDHVRDLAAVETGIGTFGVLTIPIIRALPAVYFWLNSTVGAAGGAFFLLQLLLAFMVMLVPTTLMGATFPLVAKIATYSYSKLGHSVGRVYSINTLGSVAGSILAGFVLIPLVGVRATIVTAGILNVCVAGALILFGRVKRGGRMVAAGTAAILLAAVIGAAVPEPAFTAGFTTMHRFGDYAGYKRAAQGAEVLFRDDGLYSRVIVYRLDTGTTSLFNGSFIEGSDDKGDRLTTTLLAALPYECAPHAKSALVIGLGTGYTSAAMLELPLERVETVEINPAIRDAARYFVGSRLEEDPRWRLVIDDARQHLQITDETYDVISSEPSWPLSEPVAHLFTLEFFRIVEKRLNDGGVFVQWLPRYLLQREDFMMVYRTFHTVFPNSSVWVAGVGQEEFPDLFLVGIKSESPLDASEVSERVDRRLSALGFAGAEVREMDAPETLEQAVTDPSVPLNTDDRSLLEFRAVRNLVDSVVSSFHRGRP